MGEKNGVDIQRYSLFEEPAAVLEYPVIKEFLNTSGMDPPCHLARLQSS